MHEPIVTFTPLSTTFEEFKQHAAAACAFSDYVHVDIMDGQFVATTSFSERTEINDLHLPLKYELHLMVSDPIAEMRTWQQVQNVFRVIFPIECPEPLQSIAFARHEKWEAGVSLNPNTPLTAATPILDKIDVIQFMTVHPGRQGAPFEMKVLDKIRNFVHLPPPLRGGVRGGVKPIISADGGVNPETAPLLATAGVSIFNVGSFFTKAPDMKKAYEELQKTLKK